MSNDRYDSLHFEAAAYARANAAEAEIERLRGLLKDADEAIREAPIETDGSGCFKGRANDWFDRPAVRRALGEIGGEGVPDVTALRALQYGEGEKG